ncbi:MAG: rRNA maturation RNase YbeY [Candidatus Gygaella obscura]|nr:rRNA maturation RNase YbeY [Candidatus Gygaella obscura]
MPTLKNLQKKIRLPQKKIRSSIKIISRQLKIKKDFSIVFVDNRFIKRLNKDFLKAKQSTDVLAFNCDIKTYLGDVIISVETAKQNALKYNSTFFKEIILYVIHGLLHLQGFKDYTKGEFMRMDKKQQSILNHTLKQLNHDK